MVQLAPKIFINNKFKLIKKTSAKSLEIKPIKSYYYITELEYDN